MIHPSVIKKQRRIMLVLLILNIAAIIAGLGLGTSSVSFNRLIPTILGQGTFKEEFVLFSIRLPRIIITLLAGMALAVSGAILQEISKNDLAEPGIIGINAGAGVAIAIFFLFFPIDAGLFVYFLPAVAFIGAFITAVFISFFSIDKKSGLNPNRLVLVGVGFSMALSGAMIVILSAAERQKVDFIAKWLAGNIWGADWPFIWAILPWMIIFLPFILVRSKRLNLLGLSDPVSIGIGLSIHKERIILLLSSVALASAAVSVTGSVAFIGLLAPHIARGLVGPRNQLYLPIAILLGGLLLTLADTIGRNIAASDAIPAGIVTALIGAPYFVYLLLKN